MDDDDDILDGLPVIGSNPDGSSPDSDMIPDESDILYGSSPDSDMIPDESDILYGLPVIGSDQDMSSYELPARSSYNRRSDSNFLIGNRNARLPKQIRSCADMCKILLETYNTSIIDHFSNELRFACEQEALKCSLKNDESGRKRNVLAQLITNKINLPNPYDERFDFVGGPFNITYHWSNNYKKAVYIWGERHDKNVDCPDRTLNPDLNMTNIEDFLSYHFEYPIAFSDFYLEMQAHVVPDGYQEYDTGYIYDPDETRMNILRRKFSDCVGPKHKFKRFCDNSRMHFFDIRQGDVKGGTNSASLFQSAIQKFVLEANSTLKNHKDKAILDDPQLALYDEDHIWNINCEDYKFLSDILNFIYTWKSFFDFFARFDNDTYDTKLNHKIFWYDQLRNFNLVKKEISVMHADVRPLLNFFIKDEMEKELDFDYKETAQYSKDVLDMYERINGFMFGTRQDVTEIKYLEIKELIKTIKNVFLDGLLSFNVLIADAYLLARIFKTFQIDNYHKPRSTDEPAEPHNVIIYAGNAHSQRYRKFLKYLGFKLIEESGGLEDPLLSEGEHCVDMRTITQPLFSYCPYNIEDDPVDTNYFTSYSLFKSFDSVFSTSFEGFTPFPQPLVPSDLLPFVSVNSTFNPNPTPNPRLETAGYGKTRSNRRSKR